VVVACVFRHYYRSLANVAEKHFRDDAVVPLNDFGLP
jgi:hypothetical protein